MNNPRLLIATATYNEVDVIDDLISKIVLNAPNADILVIDDSSPDGTAELLNGIQRNIHNLILMQRPRKLGIGTAHKLAITYAYLNGYDNLITMDADFSHNPHYIPIIFEALKNNDFVIGSRYMNGGSCDYTGARKFISKTANWLVRNILNVPLRETTTSFRGFSRNLLEALASPRPYSEGYSFFFETTLVACKFSNAITEIPIHFQDRRCGETKISKKEILKACFHLLKLWKTTHFNSKLDSSHTKTKNENCPSCFGQEYSLLIQQTGHDKKQSADSYMCTTSTHRKHGEIVKCLRCGLVHTNPMPNKEELKKFYSDVSDPVYLENLEARQATFRHNWEHIWRLMPPPAKLLDIGCYCGGFLDIAKETGYDVTGLEPSKWATELCHMRNHSNVTQGTISSLPITNSPFDIITAWDVIEHLDSPRDDLMKINQSLRLGGKFVFSTLNIDSLFAKAMGKHWPWYLDMHLLYFTPDTLNDLVKTAGFHVANIRPYRHIITSEYFLGKLASLGIPFADKISTLITKTPLKNLKIPFQLGDIVLVTCTKVRNIDA